MPAIRNRHHANGSTTSTSATKLNGYSNGSDLSTSQMYRNEAQALAEKKLKLIQEEEDSISSNGYSSNNNKSNNKSQYCNGTTKTKLASPAASEDVFQDTCAQPTAHSRSFRSDNGNSNHHDNAEHIIIYDGQSNTSIAQTAKDQFAAALLRLQSGLDESSRRLQTVETKVDEFIKQQQQRNQQQAKAQQNNDTSNNKKGMGKFLSQHGATIVYVGWPVLVFLAMRALERRTLASTAAAAVAAK